MSKRPILVPCPGGSPLSVAAETIVRELEQRGIVRTADGRGVDRDARVVALDGCRSGCVSRRLAAEGRPAATRINLADCGVDETNVASIDLTRAAYRVGQRLSAVPAARPLGRPHKPAHRSAVAAGAAHTTADYLLALDALTNPVVACGVLVADVPTLAAHVSEALGVSRPSAGEMLGRMERAGLVSRGSGKEILLSPGGRTAADRAIARHRLLEVFAVSTLGYALTDCYTRARALDGAFDDDALDHLRVALGDPARCPHGWAVDAAAARAESATLVSLAGLAAGESAVVACVAENDDALARAVDASLLPGAHVAPGDGAGRFQVGGRAVRLDADVAGAVFVQRHGASAHA